MSNLSNMLNDVLDELYMPSVSNQNILFRSELGHQLQPVLNLENCNHCIKTSGRDVEGLLSQRKIDTFEVLVDVQQFKPEEINVKVVGDYIVIEAKHDEREDEQGLISQQFTRRYRINQFTDTDNLRSILSSDGILKVIAPSKYIHFAGERNIPIVQTHEPA